MSEFTVERIDHVESTTIIDSSGKAVSIATPIVHAEHYPSYTGAAFEIRPNGVLTISVAASGHVEHISPYQWSRVYLGPPKKDGEA